MSLKNKTLTEIDLLYRLAFDCTFQSFKELSGDMLPPKKHLQYIQVYFPRHRINWLDRLVAIVPVDLGAHPLGSRGDPFGCQPTAAHLQDDVLNSRDFPLLLMPKWDFWASISGRDHIFLLTGATKTGYIALPPQMIWFTIGETPGEGIDRLATLPTGTPPGVPSLLVCPLWDQASWDVVRSWAMCRRP